MLLETVLSLKPFARYFAQIQCFKKFDKVLACEKRIIFSDLK